MADTWTRADEPGVDDSDADNWTDASEPAFPDVDAWKAYQLPLSSTEDIRRRAFIGVSEAAEDFHVDPMDVNLSPEYIQDDEEKWTVVFGETTHGTSTL